MLEPAKGQEAAEPPENSAAVKSAIGNCWIKVRGEVVSSDVLGGTSEAEPWARAKHSEASLAHRPSGVLEISPTGATAECPYSNLSEQFYLECLERPGFRGEMRRSESRSSG
ncbi:hypothetical protein M8818_004272 [Zalaria obscura]|uniref:Uncharacterized protein n=1 Tax=Zalaria obscura TaxID=2024903 RepID=A0ACC3SCQ2_9PEZI